jgi:hypothetical protein
MEILTFIALIAIGLIFGKINEARHYKSIIAREEKYKNVFILNDRDSKLLPISDAGFICETTVVSIDFFKKIVAGFINFF